MSLNYLAILIATVLQFIVGAIWYMPLFGKMWGEIHGFNKFSKEEQQKMMKGMGPFYTLQIFVTLVTTVVLALFVAGLPDWNVYGIAGFLWLGFVVPTQVSAVVFGGTEPKWIAKKTLIMAFGALLCLEVAALVLHLM
jgi:fatty acid desaturase